MRELTPRELRLQELREKIRQARHKNKQVGGGGDEPCLSRGVCARHDSLVLCGIGLNLLGCMHAGNPEGV